MRDVGDVGSFVQLAVVEPRGELKGQVKATGEKWRVWLHGVHCSQSETVFSAKRTQQPICLQCQSFHARPNFRPKRSEVVAKFASFTPGFSLRKSTLARHQIGRRVLSKSVLLCDVATVLLGQMDTATLLPVLRHSATARLPLRLAPDLAHPWVMNSALLPATACVGMGVQGQGVACEPLAPAQRFYEAFFFCCIPMAPRNR